MNKQIGNSASKRMTTSFTLRISQEEKDAFIDYCDKADLTTSQGIRRAMKEYMKNHPIKEED